MICYYSRTLKYIIPSVRESHTVHFRETFYDLVLATRTIWFFFFWTMKHWPPFALIFSDDLVGQAAEKTLEVSNETGKTISLENKSFPKSGAVRTQAF